MMHYAQPRRTVSRAAPPKQVALKVARKAAPTAAAASASRKKRRVEQSEEEVEEEDEEQEYEVRRRSRGPFAVAAAAAAAPPASAPADASSMQALHRFFAIKGKATEQQVIRVWENIRLKCKQSEHASKQATSET